MDTAAKKLIIALDDLSYEAAMDVVEKTRSYAGVFKVGLSLFCAHGPKILNELRAKNVDVFLDLKLHDIPMQVAKAVEEAIKFEPKFLTIHALGGRSMLQEAAKAVLGSKTQLLAVSVLTSMDSQAWQEIGFNTTIEEGAMRLVRVAYESGVRGFVSSPHEVAHLKSYLKHDCLVVCPGVRPMDAHDNDQKRIMTPFKAIEAGADFLVVGRPITKSTDVVMSAKNINQEITKALSVK